jgi:AcrR family transcriptional regulator
MGSVITATKLAHGRGFRETSLADIAEAARVPVGNVYYYFKTKQELAEAAVERCLEEFRVAYTSFGAAIHRPSSGC